MTEPRLTLDDAVAYLKLPSRTALYSFLYRRRKAGFPVTTYRLGRSLRFERSDLDAAMSCERARLRRTA